MTKVAPRDVQKLALQAKELFLSGLKSTSEAKSARSNTSLVAHNAKIKMAASGIEEIKASDAQQFSDSRHLVSKRIAKQMLKE
jgi:hypothetical protein